MTEPRLEESIFGDHDEQPLTRRERRMGRRRSGRARRWVALLLSLALVGAAAYLAFGFVSPIVASVLASNDYPGPGTGKVTVVVHPGDSGRAIASTLQEAGVVKSTAAFLEAAAARPQEAASIQPGSYTMRERMRAADALAILVDSGNRSVPTVTIPEGLWASEIFQRLSKATKVPVKNYQEAANNPDSIGLPQQAKGNVEGYLFPSTYEFPADATATQQLSIMVKQALTELDKAGVKPADREHILTIASIVEGEVQGKADRAKVARVILNRLNHDGPPNYGLLQMDSTVHYAVHKRGKAGTSNADRHTKSPYNTYKVKGLPPGPIDNPGLASIKAAAHPAKGTWLYFVTVNPSTGETRFATTLTQHQKNVALFNQWCAAHQGEC